MRWNRDARLGDDRVDERGRGDVEGRVEGRDARRGDRQRAVAGRVEQEDLGPVPPLDRDACAGGAGGIERRPGGGDDERDNLASALEAAGRAGKQRFIGFDASKKLIEALTNSKIDGLVVQNPFRMGELGVKELLAQAKGDKVESRIDTGASLVTRENMQQAEIKALLTPELSRYLP